MQRTCVALKMFKYLISWTAIVLNIYIVCTIIWRCQKGSQEGVSRRKADNTTAKGRRTKGQTTIYKTLYRKLKIAQHEPHQKPGVNHYIRKALCSTCDAGRVTLLTKWLVMNEDRSGLWLRHTEHVRGHLLNPI